MIFRAIVFFAPTVVVAFLPVSVTWISPHRPADADKPVTLRVITTFFCVAAKALPVGTATTAAPRPAITIFWKRFMVVPFSECEAFGMDEARRNVRVADIRPDGVRHCRWSADVDLALGDVRDQLLEMLGGKKIATLVGLMVA